MSDYQRYLASRHWQEVRRAMLMRTGACQKCGRIDCILEVHHLTYKRKWRERPEDLMVLCHNCHEKHHFFGMSLSNTPEEDERKWRLLNAQIQPYDDGAPYEDEDEEE